MLISNEAESKWIRLANSSVQHKQHTHTQTLHNYASNELSFDPPQKKYSIICTVTMSKKWLQMVLFQLEFVEPQLSDRDIDSSGGDGGGGGFGDSSANC